MRYHVESKNEFGNILNSEKLSGCRIGNGNYKSVYDVNAEDVQEFEKILNDDKSIVEYYTS